MVFLSKNVQVSYFIFYKKIKNVHIKNKKQKMIKIQKIKEEKEIEKD